MLFLNHADVLETHLELEYAPAPRGMLTTVEREVQIEEIGAMYLRPYDFRDFPALASFGEGSREWSHAAMLEDMPWGLADGATALVVNRPSAMLSNGSKPYQSRLIERAGFATPETLVTTDRRALERFRAAHEAVIYKSISGVRSVVQKLSPQHEGRLGDLRWCPTQFQAYVPGVEYRVHVVGTECHACRICSDGVDYRYASAQLEPCELPEGVARRGSPARVLPCGTRAGQVTSARCRGPVPLRFAA